MKKSGLKTLSAYMSAVALCLLTLILVMKLWKADLRVQFWYGFGGGDDFLNCSILKGVIDNGWSWHNRFLGMPFGLDMHDYPCADNFSIFLMKLISFLSSNYSIVVNLYFLLTFPLITLTSLFVFRRFNISFPSAIVGSLLYTFIPYHFLHGIGHLQLISYYLVPLAVMVILWVCSGERLFGYKRGVDKLGFNWVSPKGFFSVFLCVAMGFGTVYYVFFLGFLLVITALYVSLHEKNFHRLLAPTVLLVILFMSFLVNLLPTLLYVYEHGRNSAVANWNFAESEVFGLKITDLLLPVDGHRLAQFAKLKQVYNHSAPLVSENSATSLGIAGSVGFLFLLIACFLKTDSRDSERTLLSSLSILNVSSVLLGTIGGFGSLFAFLFSPLIRAYNRICIYIAFFSLFAAVVLLEKLSKRLGRFKAGRYLYLLVLSFILILGILDQTTSNFVLPYEKSKTEYFSDANFIMRIETLMPRSAMVFQLPYVPFPASAPVQRMNYYSDHFRGYLHSNTLRWSYGAMLSREADLWQQQIMAKPIDEMVETLALAGFSGIYIDRYGYADSGAELEGKLTQLLRIKPIVSANQRLAFFDMTLYNQVLRGRNTDEEWQRKLDIVLLVPQWRGGFSSFEGTPQNNWRWCSSEGELIINNLRQEGEKVNLEMTLATGYEEDSDLQIVGPSFSEKLKINAKGKFFSKVLTIPSGRYVIRFSSNAKRIEAPDDPRELMFRVINFRFF